MPIAATCMDLEINKSEVSQTERNKTSISLICGILKNGKCKLIYKAEIVSHMQKRNMWLPRGKTLRDKFGDWD